MRPCHLTPFRRPSKTEAGLAGLALVLLSSTTVVAEEPAPIASVSNDASPDAALPNETESSPTVQAPVDAEPQAVPKPYSRIFPEPWGRAIAVDARRDQLTAQHANYGQVPTPKRFGAALDIGVPDGVMGGVSVRPWSFMRAQAALGTNAVSLGLRAGLAFRLPTTVSPALIVEGGHYFEGNANHVASRFSGSSYRDSHIAEAIGYQFANFHAGLEFGNEHSTFYLHGGMTYLRAKLHNTNEALNALDDSGDRTFSIDVRGEPRLSAWIPSIKLGILVYLV